MIIWGIGTHHERGHGAHSDGYVLLHCIVHARSGALVVPMERVLLFCATSFLFVIQRLVQHLWLHTRNLLKGDLF